MALVEVFNEWWIHCSCGEQEPLTRSGKLFVARHTMARDWSHQIKVVYELQVMIVSGPIWAAAAASNR